MNTTWKRQIWAACSTATVLLLPILPVNAWSQEGAVAEGARVYGNMCGRCHNPRSPLERTDREWVAIANHMRVRGNLTGGQVRAVLAFLQATNTDPRERAPLTGPQGPSRAAAPTASWAPPSTDPQVIARGQQLANQNACLGCHVMGGAGGPVGPTLNGVVPRRGPQFVRRKLADPTSDNATSMMPNFGFTADEIEALLAYLARLNGR